MFVEANSNILEEKMCSSNILNDENIVLAFCTSEAVPRGILLGGKSSPYLISYLYIILISSTNFFRLYSDNSIYIEHRFSQEL